MVDESHLKMHHNSLQHDVTAIVGSNRRLTLGKRLPRQGGNTERIVSPWGVYKNPKRWNKREHNPAVISVQVWLNSLETTADRHRGRLRGGNCNQNLSPIVSVCQYYPVSHCCLSIERCQ